jgi:hypothetical protein
MRPLLLGHFGGVASTVSSQTRLTRERRRIHDTKNAQIQHLQMPSCSQLLGIPSIRHRYSGELKALTSNLDKCGMEECPAAPCY